jgi:membrane-associated protease RseP (regulator of RpoE activity)
MTREEAWAQEAGTQRTENPEPANPRPKLLLHLILFFLTFLTTLVAGSLFHSELSPPLDRWKEVVFHPGRWWEGRSYALSVLAILLAHEMGHYLACRHYRIPVTLPYFLPGFPFLGTFGAFIRIRGPIPDRKSLFDVGIAGPLAGFVVMLPVLFYGMFRSHIIPADAAQGSQAILGFPLLFWIIVPIFFPSIPHDAVLSLSPFLSAAWVGALATSLNLLPAGQLDGGHLCYAISRRFHARMSRATLVMVILLGALHPSWLLWAVALLFLGDRHPPLMDEQEPLSTARRALAFLAIVILLFCLIPVPIQWID